MAADVDGGVRDLKELLYRAEAERLQLQQQAAGLTNNKQQLTADVLKLRQQLAELHAAFTDSQQQVSQLTTARDKLQVQVKSAVTEYRANDIIAIGLRDQITRLEQKLKDSQYVCSEQAAVLATFSDDMASLRTCKVDLTQQLQDLQQQHQQLQEQHAGTLQQLARARQEAHDLQERWVGQHGDQARELQAVQDARQQAEDRVEALTTQLEQEQQQVQQQKDRIAELEGELSRIRDLVVLLGKAMGRMPGGQQLPSHDDPVWLKLGPLGGVSFALETVIQHTREQHVRVRELQAEFDKMEDRVRAESAQKADLQAELYDARTMYAKAVAVREALEARTTRAEAERAAAESSLKQARTQANEDGSRLTSLQEQVMALSQQVQLLQPLQPKLSTTEVERDTALHKLERLQEQYDQLQRQMQHITAREAGLQAEVDAYKMEHTQLLAANKQLMAQCTGLNKEVQALELSAREGSAAKGQLEEARRKLNRTKTQLQAMTDRHVDTLTKLETTKELLASSPTSNSSRPVSPWGLPVSKSSRPGTAASGGRPGTGTSTRRVAFPDSAGSSPRASPRGSRVGDAQQQAAAAAAANSSLAAASTGRTAGGVAAGVGPVQQWQDGGSGTADGTGSVAGGTVAATDEQQAGCGGGDEELPRSMSQDVGAMVRFREIERLAEDQQQDIEELQDQLQQQEQAKAQLELQIAQLEVQMLQQEVAHLQQLQAAEQTVSGECMGAAAEAMAALQAALQDLQQAMAGPAQDIDAPAAGIASESDASSTQQDLQHSSDGATSSTQLAGNIEQPAQEQQPKKWLSSTIAQMLGNMQTLVDEAQARARLIAARQNVGVQSDEALPSQWLAFLRSLPDAVVAQPLHLKAASEAILRIYMRGLQQLESTPILQRQQGWGRGGVGGVALTVFDLLMAHYTLPAQQQLRLSVQPYSAALWKDPQGPITRLLVSCRSLAPSSVKAALFCCLAGTHTPSLTGASWGVQHWQQFLLLLHAAKQLTGGLWKSLLRDWAAAGGALLPLQCVLDLLGNVYNASSLTLLEQQPALLGSRQQVLEAVSTGSRAPSAPGCSRVGSPKVMQGRPGTAAQQLQQQQQQQMGNVAAVMRELLVNGPLGPASAVDFDDLLAMLMVQYDAGLLPPHPLMQPRRLTTGDLGNTTNAWGSAASDAAAGVLPRRSLALSAGAVPPVPAAAVPGLLMSEASGDWLGSQSNTPAAASPVNGWSSRPTTGAGTSRIGTAAGGAAAAERGFSASAQQPGAGGTAVSSLPRIRTPDNGSLDAQRSGSGHGARSPATAAGSLPSLSGNSPAGSSVTFSAAVKQAPTLKQATSIRKGLSMARVAFREPDGLPRDT